MLCVIANSMTTHLCDEKSSNSRILRRLPLFIRTFSFTRLMLVVFPIPAMT